MKECDIKELIRLLESAVKSENWDDVEDAIGYLEDFIEDSDLLSDSDK